MKANDLGTERNMAKAMEKLRKAPPARLQDVLFIRCGSWAFGASKSTTEGNIFSARLLVRDSTVADWALLGQAIKLYGVPETVPMPATIETSPGGTHYWVWK